MRKIIKHATSTFRKPMPLTNLQYQNITNEGSSNLAPSLSYYLPIENLNITPSIHSMLGQYQTQQQALLEKVTPP